MSLANQSHLPAFLYDKKWFDSNNNNNGLSLWNVYLPEEVLLHILSYIDSKILLDYTLVCKKWNYLIKSYPLWSIIYKRKFNRKPKKLPWYLLYCCVTTNYFDINLLKNGNGENGFDHWEIKEDGGSKFCVEDPPVGADPLDLEIPEFNNNTSCFATSYSNCKKVQFINLGKSNLFRYILNNYKPHIYLSEWTAARFDCGSIYRLQCGFLGLKPDSTIVKPAGGHRVNQWEGAKWTKVEMLITGYPEGIDGIFFEHEGRDTQFWAGHFGSKMTGGVIKLLFDSIDPIPVNNLGHKQPKRFTKLEYQTNGENLENDFPSTVPDYLSFHRTCTYGYPIIRRSSQT